MGGSGVREEVRGLYREALRSLREGSAIELVDGYFSGLPGVARNPTRSESEAAHFSVTGVGERSVVYLLNVCKTSGYPGGFGESSAASGQSLDYLVAERLVSVASAMKMVSADSERELPLGVSLILLGDSGESGRHEYIDVSSLKETMMWDRDFAVHGNHVVIVESTGLRVCNVQKGCLIFRLMVSGVPHNLALPWLGETSWDALARFQGKVNDLIGPRHALYPVEYGRAPPSTTSNFLIGYPTVSTSFVRSDRASVHADGRSVIESSHYVSLPPEFSHRDLMATLVAVADEVAESGGCQLSVDETFVEEPFREDPNSPLVKAISSAVFRMTGFEPIFEWLPFPVSAKGLKASGFAGDVIAFGPGEWAPPTRPNEGEIVSEIERASGILSAIPHDVASLEERGSLDKVR